MKLKEIYELAVEMGKRYDFRGKYMDVLLEQAWEKFDQLSEKEKEFFDMESLTNPFSDSRILVGTGEEDINTILCGIDMETPEVLLADRLNEKGANIDLILAHHPEGIADAFLHDVMHLQADMMEKTGVPINVAEGIIVPRVEEVRRGRMPLNHQRAVDAARLLGFSFMCVHTAADNLASHFLQNKLEESSYLSIADILNILYKIPEYAQARKLKAGPRIIAGDAGRRAGKVFIKFTGGTAGPEKMYEKLVNAGVGTMICMHMSEKHLSLAKENNLNVIIAGHMASDSLGVNIFLDEVEKRGVNIIPCSGLIRIKRFSITDFH